MNELISVLMSTYREKAEWIKKSVESILNQSYKNLEFIIIIDEPNNEEIKNILRDYQKIDTRIKVYINEENRGLIYSLNKALLISKGKYIARMDADDISLPERLEKQKIYLEKNQFDLIGAQTISIDENGCVMTNMASKVIVAPSDINRMLSYGDCLAHPTWFGKRELFTALNGYREVYSCEDYDFLLRAVNHGAKLSNISEVLLKYRYNFSGISRSNKVIQRYTSYYLAKKRQMLDKITPEEIRSYIMESGEGKEEQEKLSDYFAKSKKILEAKVNGNNFDVIFKSIKLIFTNKYGVLTVRSILMEKYFVLKERNY